MPTQNPRVNVTLSPSLDSLVSRMAKMERVSKSQVLRELLQAAEPALQRAVALMEAASSARVEARRDLAEGLAKSQRVLEETLEENLALLAAHGGDLVSDAEAVKGRRPARKAERAPAASPKDPPTSNRGVKSVYSALNPVTGKRELLPVGKSFGRSGAVVDVPAPRRRK